jgi:hypothetical protein
MPALPVLVRCARNRLFSASRSLGRVQPSSLEREGGERGGIRKARGVETVDQRKVGVPGPRWWMAFDCGWSFCLGRGCVIAAAHHACHATCMHRGWAEEGEGEARERSLPEREVYQRRAAFRILLVLIYSLHNLFFWSCIMAKSIIVGRDQRGHPLPSCVPVRSNSTLAFSLNSSQPLTSLGSMRGGVPCGRVLTSRI